MDTVELVSVCLPLNIATQRGCESVAARLYKNPTAKCPAVVRSPAVSFAEASFYSGVTTGPCCSKPSPSVEQVIQETRIELARTQTFLRQELDSSYTFGYRSVEFLWTLLEIAYNRLEQLEHRPTARQRLITAYYLMDHSDLHVPPGTAAPSRTPTPTRPPLNLDDLPPAPLPVESLDEVIANARNDTEVAELLRAPVASLLVEPPWGGDYQQVSRALERYHLALQEAVIISRGRPPTPSPETSAAPLADWHEELGKKLEAASAAYENLQLAFSLYDHRAKKINLPILQNAYERASIWITTTPGLTSVLTRPEDIPLPGEGNQAGQDTSHEDDPTPRNSPQQLH